jgi:ABC-type nitrate/sulfonate/bicarbonate transport system substrate-binding protein
LGASTRSYALALGVDPDGINARISAALRNPYAPRALAAGSVQEIVKTGDNARLSDLPIPTWTPGKDAAPSGRVDAAWLPEPFLTSARGSTRVLSYAFDTVSKHFLLSAFCTSAQWAKDHPDLVSRFASVIRETAVWANKNPELTAPMVVRTLKLDPTVVGAMARSRYAEQLTPSLMQPLIDISAKFGGYATFPAQELIRSASQ